MATTTTDVIVTPGAWTQVQSANTTFLRVQAHTRQPWYIYCGASAPAVSAVQATGTITLTGLPVADETVTVGSITYTWKASVGATANQVLIGADAAASALNLSDAINATASASGVTFGSATVANTAVSASPAAGVITLYATTPGTAGNSVVLTEASTNTAVSGSGTLSGGAAAGSVGVLIEADDCCSASCFESQVGITSAVFVRFEDGVGNNSPVRVTVIAT